MAHRIEAFLAGAKLMEKIPVFSQGSVRIPLRCGIAMMIEPSEGLDLAEDSPLDEARIAFGRQASEAGRIGFVATAYFAGGGLQGGALWWGGKEILPFRTAKRAGPVNDVLRGLGVRTAPGRTDEFDTVGLGHYRGHRDWIDFVRNGKASWERAPSWSAE